LSMVDPDNRRPVDYPFRAEMLEAVMADLATDRRVAIRRYAKAWRDGRIKLAAIATILGYRREHAALFENGDYEPLKTEGPNAEQICAFLRCRGEEVLLFAISRFPARLEAAGVAAETMVRIPEALHRTRWYDVLSGLEYSPTSCLDAREMFSVLPAAALVPA